MAIAATTTSYSTSTKRGAPTSSVIDYSYDYDEEEDSNGESSTAVYVPLKKRREEQLKKLASGRGGLSRSGTPGSGNESVDARDKEEQLSPEELEEREKARKRQERTLLAEAQDVHKRKAEEGA